MKIFYHNDADGRCSAFIAYRANINKVKNNDLIEMDYNKDFPFDKIKKDEEVIIVDFSLQKEGEFKKLLDITKNVVWIDHHISAINKNKEENKTLDGIRRDGTAGCMLTWEYYNPNVKVPKAVEMVGHYDVWDFGKYGKQLDVLQAGLVLFDTSPNSNNWLSWVFGNGLKEVLGKGRNALQYRTELYKEVIEAVGFFAEFEGHKAVCCNVAKTSSKLFDSVKEDFDLMMPFFYDGQQYTISIYTKKDNINCSKLAEKYGGGGHVKASGFQTKSY